MAALTEEEIADIIYFARTNELEDLKDAISQLKTAKDCSDVDIIKAAIDPETGNAILHYASANGHINIIKLVLPFIGAQENASSPTEEVKAFLNIRNKSGNTPLHWAALNGQVDILLLLLRHGADPSILNEAGHDALYEAELNEKTEAVEVLLREGQELESAVNADGVGEEDEEADDVEMQDVDGNAELHAGAEGNDK